MKEEDINLLNATVPQPTGEGLAVESASSDDSMVQEAFDKLIETYLASPHRKKVELITKAFNFARQAHKGVRRLSGEPYIMHPLAVAQIVCGEIGLGSTSICAALKRTSGISSWFIIQRMKEPSGIITRLSDHQTGST